MLHDRLLRPARVVVSKQPARSETEIDDSDLGREWVSHSGEPTLTVPPPERS